MRVLVTGHQGYIGSVLVSCLKEAGHYVVGLDSGFFRDDILGTPCVPADMEIQKDLRDVELSDLDSISVVMHLGALSNDPVGELDPSITGDINHDATVRLASIAKEAGVSRFLFSSSCSTYGASETDELLDESAKFHPVTAYARSKVEAELDLGQLADDTFSPVYLRNATAYGYAPNFRADIAINNLTGWATLTGEVRLLSDGRAWRPFVHVEDIARTFLAMSEAPRESIHNQAFNVGQNDQNYQIREVAEIVKSVVPGSSVTYAQDASPDRRNYRVDFGKLQEALPDFRFRWDAAKGIEQLYVSFREFGLKMEDFEGRFVRIRRIKTLLQGGQLDHSLRWNREACSETSGPSETEALD